jgi:hypothetical protein
MLERFLAGFLLFIAHGSAFASGQDTPASSQQCAIGPQERTFGQTTWLLYGCDGATAAALVSAKGNPAAPFYFFIFRDGGGYRIYGEGVGDKNASDAAMRDLKSLPGEALARLVLEAQSPKR